MQTLGRGQAYPLENYKKGAKVWIRDPELVWRAAELLDDVTFGSQKLKLRRDDGESAEISISGVDSLPFLKNPDILIGADDLTSLSYLHEPAVLHNLEERFVRRQAIYTYCGIVLVAINPFAACSHLYADDVIQVYRGIGKQVRELDPHIYGVAEEAHFDLREYGKNQSVIVSGESGAGKTVSAKFVMRYLACVAARRSTGPSNIGVEERVLASNPILEAIGNAKTTRNDNSSRFGKFIQINVTERAAIIGAELRTYLLEKSRLVFQTHGERNYHIFYQMCASADHPLLAGYGLGPSTSYWYTAQGGKTAAKIRGVDDKADFVETMRAFDLLGFSAEWQRDVLRLLAGILLLGNVGFKEDGNESATIDSQNSTVKALEQLCSSSLFGLSEPALRTWLTQKELRAAGETVRKPLTTLEAVASRDALAKQLYASLFAWVVARANEALAGASSPSSTKSAEPRISRSSTTDAPRFIGVLDIYGFETFEQNSFEQFCINYANEKLQQQFNQHVFKLEQAEYEREEIAWVRIDFYDNQPAIDLIEGRPGLIDYLDEQCKMPRGSDAGWLSQLTNCASLKRAEHFVLPKIQAPTFMVRHFAADVSYTVDGFLEKNRDSVSEQLVETFATAEFAFLHDVLSDASVRTPSPSAAGRRVAKRTVATQFRDSLRDLMTVLESTRPHYVRCIKPNDEKEAWTFCPRRSIEQLRACGVLETVRISAAGYPSRWQYDDFGKRYRVLYTAAGSGAMWRDKPKQFAERACAKCLEEGKYALGRTKIFFRTGQVALLERLRAERLGRAAISIQTAWRGHLARQRYERLRAALATIQAALRAHLVYRRLRFLQMHRAAVAIQTCWRAYRERRRFRELRTATLAIQSAFRAQRVRTAYRKARYEHAVVRLQAGLRGWLVRRAQIERNRRIVRVQACVRRWLARRRLRELKAEARSVGHLQKLNKALDGKIIELKLRGDMLKTENSRLIDELGSLRTEFAAAEMDRQSLAIALRRVEELSADVERLETDVDVSEAKRAQLEQQLNTANTQMEQMRAEQTEDRARFTEKLDKSEAELDEAKRALRAAEERLTLESSRRGAAEQEMSAMREQLLANASLLASSPALSRIGSMRAGHHQAQPLGKLSPGSSSGVSSMCSSSVNGGASSSGHGGQADNLGVVMMPPHSGTDMDEMALILRQQELINTLRQRMEQHERENDRLKNMLDSNTLIDALDRRPTVRSFDAQRLQELEMAHTRLRAELDRLIAEREAAGGLVEGADWRLFVDRILEENDRRREESVELRSILTARYDRVAASSPDSGGHWSSAGSDSAAGADLDDELCVERQCRQLKTHIESLSRSLSDRNRDVEQLERRLRQVEENSRTRAITSDSDLDGERSRSKTSDVSTHDAGVALDYGDMAHEVRNLAANNVVLNEKLLRAAEELADARGQLRGYTANPYLESTDADVVRLETLEGANGGLETEHSALLEVFHIPEFARILITDLKPRLARQLAIGAPAHLLLLAFRYYDQTNDEAALTTLFSTAHAMIKDAISRSYDIDVLSLWLVNSWKLLNLLRQYGGDADKEPDWATGCTTDRQRSHRLRRFDVAPLREQLAARVTEAYENLMKRVVEQQLRPKIVPALLQHESAAMSGGITTPQSSASSNGAGSGATIAKALDDLVEFLSFVHAKLKVLGADTVLLGQVFKQCASWLAAIALNHWMFRRELCTFEKAVLIKHNVCVVQSWMREKQLNEHAEQLDPLVQACHLLQSRKDESNIETLCGEMTDRLKPRQVVALLQHYSPSGDGFEERTPEADLLVKIQVRLQERERARGATDDDQRQLIAMGTYVAPFDVRPFVPSPTPLEQFALPAALHLHQVARLL